MDNEDESLFLCDSIYKIIFYVTSSTCLELIKAEQFDNKNDTILLLASSLDKEPTFAFFFTSSKNLGSLDNLSCISNMHDLNFLFSSSFS